VYSAQADSSYQAPPCARTTARQSVDTGAAARAAATAWSASTKPDPQSVHGVAFAGSVTIDSTWSALSDGFADHAIAAIAATCGADALVP